MCQNKLFASMVVNQLEPKCMSFKMDTLLLLKKGNSPFSFLSCLAAILKHCLG